MWCSAASTRAARRSGLSSGATGTTMLGNVIDSQLITPGLQGQGAVFSMLFLLALIVPMIYYVVATNRSSREAA